MTDKSQPSLGKGAFHCLRCGVNAPRKYFRVDRTNNLIPETLLDLKAFRAGEAIPKNT